jgi:hypothetical protein
MDPSADEPRWAAIGCPQLRPWHFVLWFALVSLFADMVYEGARAIIGPYLATLGASATVVGAVAGAGKFIGYSLRVVSGYLVQRGRHYWTWTIAGYALTVLAVPLIGSTNVIAPALLLYGTERLSKAVRSPAKDTLLSHAATRTGRGTAFGVHQGMDQFGAGAGPLLLAAVLWQHTRDYRLALGVLIVPGILVLALLFWLRHRVPDPAAYEMQASAPQAREAPRGRGDRSARVGLPPPLLQYIGAIALLSLGVASFPLLAFHAQTQGLLTPAQVPVLFALAMLVDGMSGLLMGRVYDRRGPRVLLVVPVVAGVAAIASPTMRPWSGSACPSGESSTVSWTRPPRLWSPSSSPRLHGPSRSAGWPWLVASLCWWRAWPSGRPTTRAPPWSSGWSWAPTRWR